VETNRSIIYSLQALFEQVVESRHVIEQELLADEVSDIPPPLANSYLG
jgi:hypothetical protein